MVNGLDGLWHGHDTRLYNTVQYEHVLIRYAAQYGTYVDCAELKILGRRILKIRYD